MALISTSTLTVEIMLDENRLSGIVHSEMASMQHLEHFSIADNQITGTVVLSSSFASFASSRTCGVSRANTMLSFNKLLVRNRHDSGYL